MRTLDLTFDYKRDKPAKNRPDADRDSPRLRRDHELLWTKEIPSSGVLFAPTPPSVRRKGYLIYSDAEGSRHWYGSDAITASYTTWIKPKALVAAKAELTEEQRSRYLDPPYTLASAMIWPVRSKDRPTINAARGLRIGDRIDLTLECVRRHYAEQSESPLAGVMTAYSDFFALFDGFVEFVDFFHFQGLVSDDYKEIRFLLPFDNFDRPATPTSVAEYVAYREATLDFISIRKRLIADWVVAHHPKIEVVQ